jgi:hypothetical protein
MPVNTVVRRRCVDAETRIASQVARQDPGRLMEKTNSSRELFVAAMHP